MDTDPSPPEQNPLGESEEPWVEGFERSEMDREIGECLSKIHDNSLSFVLEQSRQWEDLDKEMELKEEAIKKQTLELKVKREELVRGFEEREKKVELLEVTLSERFSVLEEKENNFDLKQEKFVQGLLIEKYGELVGEIKAVKEEVGLVSKKVDERSCELERIAKELDMKQASESESGRKEAELMEMSLKKLITRENELDKTIKEKVSELEKKEEEQARNIEEKSKLLELKEKKLEEREKEINERLVQAMFALKRSRLGVGTSSLAGKGRDAGSLTPPGKRQKPITEHNHNDEEKGSAIGGKARSDPQSEHTSKPKTSSDPASEDTSKAKARYDPASEDKSKAKIRYDPAASGHTSKGKRSEVDEVICIDLDEEDDPGPFSCPDPDFNKFNKTMESFSTGQVWALYEPLHLMPRYYAVIKRILKPELSLRVEWLEPEENSKKEYTIACGDFKYGKSDTQSYMAFSHEMHFIKKGKNVTINPRKGETWALFSDRNKTRNSQRKPAYKYEFVEIVAEFDSHLGIGVAYLESVEGFTSVYQRTKPHPIFQVLISPNEMHRFSHSVPSYKLTGAEKGVPVGSFELDPAAIPIARLKAAKIRP